jgi:hypothetical protein
MFCELCDKPVGADTDIGFLCGCHSVAYCSQACQVNNWEKHRLACSIVRVVSHVKGFNDTFKLPTIVEDAIRTLGRSLTLEDPGMVGFSVYAKRPKQHKGWLSRKIDQKIYHCYVIPAVSIGATEALEDSFLELAVNADAFRLFIPVVKFTLVKYQVVSLGFGLIKKN